MELAVLLQLLTPALPFLVGLAGKVADGAASKVGEDIWEKVKGKIGPKLMGHAIAQPAIAQMQSEPDNANFKAMLELALKDILEKDASLAGELGKLLEPAKADASIAVNIQSQGDHNVNVGVNYGQM